jgi:hypothetical protein
MGHQRHSDVRKSTGTNAVYLRRILRNFLLIKATPEHLYEFLRNILQQEPIVTANSRLKPKPFSVHLTHSSSTYPTNRSAPAAISSDAEAVAAATIV